ncbi:hypothetical protein ACWJKU_09335 [Methylocaldum sp. MU1018]
MNRTQILAFFLLFPLFLPAPVAGETRCQSESVRVRPPARVLIIPLLREDPESAENERWPERPAAQIDAFYRARFSARVTWMRDIRTWEDYYRQAALLMRRSPPFDRVVFIGHGGFDGPILSNRIVQNTLIREGREAKASRVAETQPGIEETFSVTYDIDQNREFSRFMNQRWKELSRKDPSEARNILTSLERKLAPLDAACLERQCSAANLASAPSNADREIQRAACESVCRSPLFVSRISEDLAPERFRNFAQSLRSLVEPNGLIMLGMCNPGSRVPEPEQESPWDVGGALVHSALASGPHQTYVHLLAAATGRTVAGPIGKTSAEDVVSRITLFEERRPQRYLRIVASAASCAP